MVFRPDTFGKYVLLKRIAVGGMAEVFRAKTYGAEGFEKTVAIKRMLPHLSSDSQFVNMFINEAKLTASLTHANIAQIYDFGCIENMYFLSMEYVLGKDLADLIRMLREKGLGAPIELACHVIIETLNGLDYAHRKTDAFGNPLNLIHRDTSPHNLIISYEGEVKIVDFGIAKAKSTTVQTTGGVLKGKYSYMSPEQAHGMPLDHRSDIFSLGICFYELLTLTKMFQGSSDLSVLEKVRETDFIPPRQLNEAIPEKLEELMLKALEKNPDDRWESAAQWREALEDFLFNSNLHYSTAWLSGFMREIFGEDIDREMQELGEEDEIAKQLKKKARRIAKLQSFTDTVKYPVENDLKSEHTENRPPIREISSGEFVIIDNEEPMDDEEFEEEEEDLSLLDTAIAASPLGRQGKVRADHQDEAPDEEPPFSEPSFSEPGPTFSQTLPSMADLPVMDETDDESMPTIELSRPNRGSVNIPPRTPALQQSANPIDYDEEIFDGGEYDDEDGDSSLVTTMDERNQPAVKGPQGGAEIDEEDFSSVTTRDEKSSSSVLSRLLARKNSDSAPVHEHTGEAALDPGEFYEQLHNMDDPGVPVQSVREFNDDHETTTRGKKEGFSSFTVVLTLLIALGVGGLVALWQVSFGDNESASSTSDKIKGQKLMPFMDGGFAAMVGRDDKQKTKPTDLPIAQEDGGTSTDKPVNKADASIKKADTPDKSDTRVLTTPASDNGKPTEQTAETPVNGNKEPTPRATGNRKKRRRRSHRTKTSCPTRGYGTIKVGVSAGWAFVFVDGKKIRTTPLLNYKIRAGRHKIVLKKGKTRIVKRWNTCIRKGHKVTLIYQNN